MKTKLTTASQPLDTGHTEHDEKTIFGFWVYLMTDLVLFATLFATFAVLRNNTAGGTALGDLFELPYVLGETLLLLVSSFTCGLAVLAARYGKVTYALLGLGMTALLGAGFLYMELAEFNTLIAEGESWRENAALSAFFTLVATHGLHITIGLVWIGVMAFRIRFAGLTNNNLRRITLLGLFWHFLDIVWIFIFTFVYLMGASL